MASSSIPVAKVCSVAQSCQMLCDPMNYSPPVTCVHGSFQTRILELVAISFPWQLEVEVVMDFLFLDSRISVDGDWSHETERHLLLGREAMTKLDSILKSRDITLMTKVHAIKTIIFPVVLYRCESWTIKKAEHQRTDVFELQCRRYFRVPSVLWPPDVNWLIWKVPDAGNNWRWEEKGTTEDEMVGWHHRLDGHECERTPGVGDAQGGLGCCDSWGRKESDTTERLNWTELECKEIKPVNPKGNQPWIFIIRTDAEDEALILWALIQRANPLEKTDPEKDWRQEEKGMTEYEMVWWHHWHNEHDLEQTLGDSEGQGSLAGCSSWGCKELDMT